CDARPYLEERVAVAAPRCWSGLRRDAEPAVGVRSDRAGTLLPYCPRRHLCANGPAASTAAANGRFRSETLVARIESERASIARRSGRWVHSIKLSVAQGWDATALHEGYRRQIEGWSP